MMKPICRLILSLILLLSLNTATSHAHGDDQVGDHPLEPTVRFTHLTIDDGLAGNWVQAILQDRHGFMWIGTRNGLSRFDGYQFTTFRHDPDDPNSLSDNHVRDLFEDRQGQLWIATEGGINRFEPVSQTFSHYPLPDQPSGPEPIFSIFQDSQGNLWFGGPPHIGFNKFDPVTETFSRYLSVVHKRLVNGSAGPPPPPALPPPTGANQPGPFVGGGVWQVVEDEAGNLWLAADFAVAKFDPQTDLFTYYPVEQEMRLAVIYQDTQENLWIGGSTGFYRFEPQTGQFINYPGLEKINSVIEDESGLLWISTQHQGLYRFDPQTEHLTAHFLPDTNDVHSLSDDQVTVLYEDEAGVLWIGTINNGLNLFDPQQTQFAAYQHDPDNPNSPAPGSVGGITGDDAGNIWFGTQSVVNRFDLTTKQITHYPLPNAPSTITALYHDQQGVIWVGRSGGVYYLTDTSDTFTQYDIPFNSGPKLPGAPIAVIGPPMEISGFYEDELGQLWIPVLRRGLYWLDAEREAVHSFNHIPGTPSNFNDSQTIIDDLLTAIHGDQQGTIWLGYMNGFLSQLEPTSKQFTHYQLEPNPGWIEAIHQDSQRILWLGTRGGLCRFDPQTNRLTRYTEKDGLPSSFVVGILEDEAGHLWLSTKKGLAKFDPAGETFTHYDVEDGLSGNEFNFQAAWRRADGQLVFGGNQGLTIFDPATINDNVYHPPVVLTQLRLFNEPVSPNKALARCNQDGIPINPTICPRTIVPLQQPIWALDALTLRHDQNIVTFEFAALSYAAAHQNRYRYRLDDIETGWNYVTSDRRFATYTTLPPGDYQFQVQATNEDGEWSEHELNLTVTILPPWWRTTWFYGLALTTMIGLVFGGYRWRVRTIEKRNRLLEQQVAKRTQELADSETRFRGLSRSTFEAIIIHHQGHILDVNQATLDMFGYSLDDLIGKHIRNFITFPSQIITNRQMNRGTEEAYQIEGITKDGGVIPLEVRSKEIPYQGRQVRVAAVRDITERKQAEERLRQAKEAAEAANQAKSSFLANMSHELRSPLNAILGFAQVMQQNSQLSPDQHNNLNIILRSGEHLLSLINQVLDLSKVEAGRVTINETNFDLYSLLHDVEDMFILKAQKKELQFLVEYDDDLPTYIRTDAVKLRQVLINLLNNALKFTEEGGVAVRVSTLPLSPDKPAPHVNLTVEVRDTGPGIAPAEMEKLFQAFYQTTSGREAQEGTGLGLAISYKFVQLMGGQMSVDSEIDRGSCFKFHIPVQQVNQADIATTKRNSERQIIALEPGQPRYRILIVDDRWTNRQLLIKLLSPLGFEIQEAENGQEAIELWDNWQPHLIWMDMRMPVMDGYEATKQIKANLKGQATAIIALTASAFEEERAVVLNAGCDDFLRKPFRTADIFDLMHKHIGVRYIYEDPPTQPAIEEPPISLSPPEIEMALTQLPLPLLTKLKEATELSDMEEIEQTIQAINEEQPHLGDALKTLANDFAYDKILQLLNNSLPDNP